MLRMCLAKNRGLPDAISSSFIQFQNLMIGAAPPDMFNEVSLERSGFMQDQEVRMESPQPVDLESMKPKGEIPACVQFFRRGVNGQLLTVALEPSDANRNGFGVWQVKDWIRIQGCGEWLVLEDAIKQLARESRRIETSKEYTIAERRDFRIETQVSPDHRSVWIRVVPAFGGETPTENSLRKALADRNIRFGIKEELLLQILQEGGCERSLVAEGIPPVQGDPVKFEPQVQESEHKGVPQERENGTVDYKNLGLFTSVSEGTPLLRRIPPGQGIPGTGVDGAPIPALPGNDRVMVPGPGTAFSKEDSDLITAVRVGRPAFDENTVRVDPTLELDTVDPSTGNVVFEGNILIRGCVESGFTVKAGQDLTILDTVEGAHLNAGKNLLLLTGVYGRNKSEIVAGGNIEARFLSDCRVRSRGNIDVADLLAHCSVECEGALRIGKGGGKGQAFGGRLSALRGIQAQILGSVSEKSTLVEIAAPRTLLAEKSRISSALGPVKNDFLRAEKELKTIPESEEESPRAKKLKARLAGLASKIQELQSAEAGVQARLGVMDKASIKAADVHRGVTLCIGETRQAVSEYTTDVYLTQRQSEKKNIP
jgi:uncharacterized protein